MWIAGDWSAGLSEVGASRPLDVKLRHGPRLVAATVTRTGAASGHVRLDERDKGIAAGQVVALYDGETCVGSGMICSAVELGDAPEVIVPRKRGTSGYKHTSERWASPGPRGLELSASTRWLV